MAVWKFTRPLFTMLWACDNFPSQIHCFHGATAGGCTGWWVVHLNRLYTYACCSMTSSWIYQAFLCPHYNIKERCYTFFSALNTLHSNLKLSYPSFIPRAFPFIIAWTDSAIPASQSIIEKMYPTMKWLGLAFTLSGLISAAPNAGIEKRNTVSCSTYVDTVRISRSNLDTLWAF